MFARSGSVLVWLSTRAVSLTILWRSVKMNPMPETESYGRPQLLTQF
jgi:hypothetical protein